MIKIFFSVMWYLKMGRPRDHTDSMLDEVLTTSLLHTHSS